MMQEKMPAWLPSTLVDRLTVYANREDWLEARKERIAAGSIGSTTASALLGLSPWKTPWDCWAAVHAADRIEERPMNVRLLSRGLALEPLADRLYREETEAETWGVAEHMAVESGHYCVSPDAFARHPSSGVGVAEYKIIQPWRRDKYPAEYLEIQSLADLDAASTLGRWPVDRQYVIQCMMHLLATGLDYVDLFAVFAHDVQLGYQVEGWDTPIAVEGTSRMRIYNNPEMLSKVSSQIDRKHQQIIVDDNIPDEYAPPPPWDTARDPLQGKRDATAEEVTLLEELAEKSARAKVDKSDIASMRSQLRDTIADSGNKGIVAQSTSATKITATVSKNGRLTVRGI